VNPPPKNPPRLPIEVKVVFTLPPMTTLAVEVRVALPNVFTKFPSMAYSPNYYFIKGLS
jgi:hypothetical protein